MNIKFTKYQKFDHNINIKILDFSDIIKFYNRFEKSTKFKNCLLNTEFNLEKLIKYIETKFKNYIFDNSVFVYELNIEINENTNYMLILSENVKNEKINYIVEHIFY